MKLLSADKSFDDIGTEIIERNLKTGGTTNMSYMELLLEARRG